jgi:glutathionylspermidine synthase
MSAPLFSTYAAFAEALQRTNRISDPWLDGRERFALSPVVLSSVTYARLCAAAELIGAVYEELCQMVWNEPLLLSFFDLTPHERLMWFASGGAWHGIARLDLFLLKNGRIQMCEMNSDTPSGEAEAVVLNAVLHPSYAHTVDPNESFEHRFVELVRAFAPNAKTLGIIFPTEIPEDLSMILCYEEWLQDAGFTVFKGAPYNLQAMHDGGIGMFGKPLNMLLRHYKTDWWGERESVWQDGEAFPDAEPLHRELMLTLDAVENGLCAVVNPFGAVLTQNKLTMAFMYTFQHRFSEAAQQTIRELVPETYRLCDVQDKTMIEENKQDWVLKSDYGCEGAEVIIGKAVSDEIWQRSIETAIPTRWILQSFFEAVPTAEGYIPNYGVYLLGGTASGIYTRLAPVITDYHAISAATFIVS